MEQFPPVSYHNGHIGSHGAVLKDPLFADDAPALVALISDSLRCSSDGEFSGLLKRLSDLLRADFCMCALININARRRIRRFDVLNGNFPSEWLETYLSKKYYLYDPIVRENHKHFKVQSWEDTYPKYRNADHIMSHAREFSLERGCSYGIKSDDGRSGSLFSFSGASVWKSERNSTILKFVIPVMHVRLMALLNSEYETDKKKLTETERKIVECMAKGMSNPRIAETCAISRNTVKFHIKNILQKMNVENRIQAVTLVHKSSFMKELHKLTL